MVASAADMVKGLKNEGDEVAKYLAMTGSMSIQHLSVTDGVGNNINVAIGTEAGDASSSLKVKSIKKALRAVADAGFALVDLTFHCSSAVGVPCVAFMGNRSGLASYTVFMGPKTGQHTPQTGQLPGLRGGLGAAHRGVADQLYDGTQRWFGNPKQHAHATAVVIHEIGHVLHAHQSPALFWDMKLARIVDQQWVALAPSVSHYATKNDLEFVAEIFAGTISGKAYAGVQAAYAALGGPQPAAGNFP